MLKASARTNVGRLRSVNQDTVFVSAEPVGPLPNLFIVADGMGGHNAGDIASKAATQHFCDHLKAVSEGSEDILDLLTSAMRVANLAVLAQAGEDTDLSGMGTTLTACCIQEGKCFVIHIGDSRAYLISPDSISQLTHDHSYVYEMVKAGQMTHEEAREHPKRNVITRVLGISQDMTADGYVAEVKPGSVILLCSDGLSNIVPEEQLRRLVYEDDAAEALVTAAGEGGGTDDISVVIIEIVSEQNPKPTI